MLDMSPSSMAFTRLVVSPLMLVCLLNSCCKTGKANAAEPETGTAGYYGPAQIITKALLCFNDKYVYKSCEESYRLNESGDLNIPLEQTDQYCEGPCAAETHLVLDCIDNILSNFLFYNQATINDVRETIQAGCGYGPGRGNFNVAEHIEAEADGASMTSKNHIILHVLGLMSIGLCYVL